jgi:hypothetical protein
MNFPNRRALLAAAAALGATAAVAKEGNEPIIGGKGASHNFGPLV